MKVVKDYTDFTTEKGGRFQMYTVSLKATWDIKEPADYFAEVLEEIKKQLASRNGTVHVEYNKKF